MGYKNPGKIVSVIGDVNTIFFLNNKVLVFSINDLVEIKTCHSCQLLAKEWALNTGKLPPGVLPINIVVK